jgi:hypothetical protein
LFIEMCVKKKRRFVGWNSYLGKHNRCCPRWPRRRDVDLYFLNSICRR